jgi:hypothetical protein
MIRKPLLATLCLALACACQSTVSVNGVGAARTSRLAVTDGLAQLRGRVRLEGAFATKALTAAAIASGANVTLRGPNNVTLAAGLTDANGQFTLFWSNRNFQPIVDAVYVLDVAKRLNTGAYVNTLGLRTIVKKTATGWSSMTGTTIEVNAFTTAAALILAGDPTIAPSAAIGMVDLQSGSPAFVGLATRAPAHGIAEFTGRVAEVVANLNAGVDPMGDAPATLPGPVPATKVAYNVQATPNNDLGQLYVANPDGTQANAVPGATPTGDIQWSPDGRELHYNVGQAQMVVGRDGLNRRMINPIQFNINGAGKWAPDGKSIAYDTASGPASDIFISKSDASGTENFTNTSDMYEISPAWSPDGHRIAYLRGPANFSQPSEVWVKDRHGSPAIHMVTSGTQISGILWSPDGGSLLLNSPDGIQVVPATPNGVPRMITDPQVVRPVFSRDGRRIAYAKRYGNGFNFQYETCIVNADGTGQQILTNSADRDEYPADFSPDGMTLITVVKSPTLPNGSGLGTVTLASSPSLTLLPAIAFVNYAKGWAPAP